MKTYLISIRFLAPVIASAALLCGNVFAAASCSLLATPVSFGTYRFTDPLPASGTGNIQVTCQDPAGPATISYAVSFSAGYSGNYAARQLAGASALLSYNLYADAAHSLVWGDGVQSGSATVSDSYTATPLAQSRDYTVYGTLFANQPVAAGAYSDVITVTVSY